MKKILCIIDVLGSGGAQRQMVELSRLLKEKGNLVKIITYYDNVFYLPFLEKYGVEYEYVKGANNKYSRIPKLIKAIRQYKPDTVVAYLDTPCIIACLAKLSGNKFKLIVSERNTTQRLSFAEKLKFFLYRFADVIVPNSYSQEKFIIKHYPNLAKKVKTVTNTVDTDYFTPESKSFEHTKQEVQILCVGRVCEQKNIMRFLDAIALLQSKGYKFHINWFGKKELNYYKSCCDKINELKLSSVFEFKEPSQNIKLEYQHADVFCLPSIYEGFPNVVCEAMSCGLLVLCSNVCDNPNIVRNGENGLLFDPFDEKDIAEKIQSYIEMPDSEKESMSKKSRAFAIKDFSSDTFINKYNAII